MYWEWPVRGPSGDHYERIILSTTTAYADADGGATTREHMRAFAGDLVAASAALADKTTTGTA